MLDSVEKCSEPRMTSRNRVKLVPRLWLHQCRDASFAIRTGNSPAAEGDKRGLDNTERNDMSSEPTAGDKRRVPDAGGIHTEDGIEASLLQDDLDLAMLKEEIAPFMSFPSLREILAGNSETNGLAQSVSLTKPEQGALMMQPLEPEEFFEFLHNVGHHRLSAKNTPQADEMAALNKNSYSRVGGSRTRSIQPIASVGSAFTMWQPRERQIPSDEELIANLARCAAPRSDEELIANLARCAAPRSDEELIANLARCAAPTGVRLAAITAGESLSLSESLSESESESESDGKDVCLGGVAGVGYKRRARGGDRADNMSGPCSNAAENKVRQELRQKLLKRRRDDRERAAAPAAGASELMEMEGLSQDHAG